MSTERILNGTFGELWLDGEQVGECFGLIAEVEFEKEEIPMCGKLGVDTKLIGTKGTGSMKLRKVNSRMILKISSLIKRGINPRFLVLSAIKDPAALGAERTTIKDACFDKLILANWEVKTPGEEEYPFTFTDWDIPDAIQPR